MGIPAGTLDRELRIERPVAATRFTGAGSGTWETVDTVRANVRDALPSRAESLADGINASRRPARVRMHRRADIRANMRFVIKPMRAGEVDRIVQIVSGPADIEAGGIEFMVEEYGTAGNGA